jgi:heat shock protein HslJ
MRRSITTTLVALAAAGMLIAGCGGDDDTGSTSPGDPSTTTSSEPGKDPTTTVDGSSEVPGSIAGRTWLVTGIVTVGGPQPVPSGVEATLTFHADGTLDVNAGCNSGSGDASFDGDTVSASVAVTEMACTDRDRMDVEQAVLAVLGSPMHWAVGDDTLLLTPTNVSDSGLQLRDAATPPSTTVPPNTTAPTDTTAPSDTAGGDTPTSDSPTSDSPTSDAPTTAPTGDAAPADETTALLAAVAANRVFDDNSFGGSDDVFDAIGVVDALATVDDDGFAQVGADARPLSPEERAAITEALAPLPVRWIEPGRRTAVFDRIMDGTARLGAVVTLAEPEIDDTTATAHSELYCGGLCAIGGAHELERQPDGTWKVTGEVGPQWIS